MRLAFGALYFDVGGQVNRNMLVAEGAVDLLPQMGPR